MNRSHLFRFLLTFLLFPLPSLLADEAGAKKVVADYEREVAAWVAKVNAAPDVEARRQLWKVGPNPDAFGQDLLRQLDGSWNQDWFLDYAPKLLELAPAYSVKPVPTAPDKTPLSVVRSAAERFHFESPKIGALCLALVVDNGPKTRKFLEKVELTHPDKEVQGVAAFALVLLSREMGGGDLEANKQRMERIRKAVIQSAHVKVGQTTIGEMVERFLFATMNLEKGMKAPDILGWNVAGDAMRLKDYRGQPVMIVFWHTRMEAADETMAFLRKVTEQQSSQGAAILGVASESPEQLRHLIKDGTVTWENWLDEKGEIAELYQVARYPACWVLDKQGKIQHRGVPGPFAELTLEALLKE
ncbi:peroxiredoxin family protein [Roseibacillus ishigakijimensis]|uniref:TlpA family protein disulfide reductase n=1 Tax=Roseibacillus ishigakijimensis TaxID=454146 RepID=A0A934RQV4_9BACT|nr:TlpA disulfide reductase family protein [Roseibacillus ishigakijimensis]MBK1834222.1 TlpA family protein disulfide reductase [Roseibacillus ishigakijimensis]